MPNQVTLAECHVATIKHAVIAPEKIMGIVKKYIQLKAATAAKQAD